MINKESQILYVLAKEPWRKYTFTEIKTITKKKSKSYIDIVLKKLINEAVIKQEHVGNLPVYSLNIDSIKARVFAGFALEHYGWNKKHIPYKSLKEIIEKVPYNNYIFLITGSYVKEKQNIHSDIDIVILVEDLDNPKRVYAELSFLCEISIPAIHLYVFKHSEFIKMICNKELNYGKEIIKNCLILTEGQVYIKLIKEAIEHGFNDKYLAQ